MMERKVSPALHLQPIQSALGHITLPGSKSISNRVLLLSALAEGTTTLHGLLDADDTRVMQTALQLLGVELKSQTIDPPSLSNSSISQVFATTVTSQTVLLVKGCAGAFLNPQADLFLGNAGTAIRPLTAALAILGGDYHVHGVARMHERPIGDLVDGLIGIGAKIDYLGQVGFPPLQIHSGQIQLDAPVKVRGDVSSQYLTALLMALPLTKHPRDIHIEVVGELISKPYIEITLRLVEKFGVKIINHNWQSFVIPAFTKTSGAVYQSPGDFWVEGDASSASYFLAMGALGGGPLMIQGVGRDSIQGDVAFAGALSMMGANISQGNDWIEVRGFEQQQLQAIELDCTPIPDAAMTLAVLGLFAKGTTRLTGIASWRVKETDRIAAMECELRKFGALVVTGDDFIEVTAPQSWTTPSGGVDTYDDHRMAMCFSLAAFGPVSVQINDPDCVSKTFPDYFKQFNAMIQTGASK